ncbi:MAG TPA: hypothetical protein VFK44_09305 [Bacillales bacterium]|nr:hypothetical protein [Bacillales bacterium]
MKFWQYHKNIKVRFLQLFLTDILNTALLAFMAIYLTRFFGAALTGLFLFINIVLGVFANFYGGYYSDIIGKVNGNLKSFECGCPFLHDDGEFAVVYFPCGDTRSFVAAKYFLRSW